MSFFKRNKPKRVVLPCLIESLSDQGAQIDAVEVLFMFEFGGVMSSVGCPIKKQINIARVLAISICGNRSWTDSGNISDKEVFTRHLNSGFPSTRGLA